MRVVECFYLLTPRFGLADSERIYHVLFTRDALDAPGRRSFSNCGDVITLSCRKQLHELSRFFAIFFWLGIKMFELTATGFVFVYFFVVPHLNFEKKKYHMIINVIK